MQGWLIFSNSGKHYAIDLFAKDYGILEFSFDMFLAF